MKQIRIIAVSLLLLSGLFTQAQFASVSPVDIKITSVEDGVNQLKTIYKSAPIDQLKTFIVALYSKYSVKEVQAVATKKGIACFAACGANWYICTQTPINGPGGTVNPPNIYLCDAQLATCRAACVAND